MKRQKVGTSIITLVLCSLASSCHPSRLAPLVEEEERSAMSKETVVLDIQANSVDSMGLSEIVRSVDYVPLESDPQGILSVPMNVKYAAGIYYVSDIDEHLFCFDDKGQFLRKAFRNGKGKGEVIRMYDYDVDESYLYILDGVVSRILRFTHDGTFVNVLKLPFRALRFMKTAKGYVFQLAPYTLKGEDSKAQVILTDADFKVKCEYSKYDVSSCTPVTRTPYFSRCGSRIAFAPVYGRSLYDIEGDSALFMRFYYEYPGEYYEPSKAYHGAEEAAKKSILYSYENAIVGDDYIIQQFVTSKEFQGTLFVNNTTNDCLFVKRIVQDRDDAYMFDFICTKSYDPQQHCYLGIASRYYANAQGEEVREIRKKCNSIVSSLLVSDNEPYSENPLIIRYRLCSDIRKR